MKNEVCRRDVNLPDSLYVHIPFCRRECFYCNFFKIILTPESEEKYTALLQREIELRGRRDLLLRTVYFGGGSPAAIRSVSLERIVESVHLHFDLSGIEEMTIEVNPEEGSEEKFDHLRRLGFNRVSIGVQSFSDNDLKYLSRNHDSSMALNAVKKALKAGFGSVNADLIIGIPSQKRSTLIDNIDTVSSLGVDHVSAYLLEGVRDYGGRKRADPEDQASRYDLFREKMAAKGYGHYEVSNFCRNGKVSLHNLNYWEGGSYIGAGLSASGYEEWIDYSNHTDTGQYEDSIKSGLLPVSSRTVNDRVKRDIFTGLRLVGGIEKNKTGGYEKKIKDLVEEGLIEETALRYRVIPSQLVILNEILSYIF